ncbi:capsule biosynthesis protein [Campylobacter sp. MIT 99-7217]|uniref:capsular polysaccharide biosynthesis protein n=1 Tax=Campylobacter sp. MIT 99-7217 TaxID=535091 RepID=UPI00115723CF|nr:capsular polysaccharide biosynthesis protein [Campylobacter sp. MIT 99-7217]TQR34732.1 capsule biosynthesis protein [Campylobacter sp. MIT 99-7217]
MLHFSSSKKLIKSVKDFITIKPYPKSYDFLKPPLKEAIFYGWGRKKSGQKAIELAQKYGAKFMLLEDGFIRSLALGVENSPSFSLVFDELGIYYDANKASKLEELLNHYDFSKNLNLLQEAKTAIKLIKKYQISKYNTNQSVPKDFFKKDEKRILIITQTANDASLKYGLAQNFDTENIIKDAINENKEATIYIKIHPDVLSGKKKSDFNVQNLPQNCILITQNFNPIDLLSYFEKVYTKTSGMGFEALIMGVKCVCYGLPFYAGWGLSEDKLTCQRRTRKLSLEELFAGAYILYPRYFNPYLKQNSNIIDTIKTLAKYKKIEQANSHRLFFLGFSLWKRWFMKPFFKAKNNQIIFLSSLQNLQKLNIKSEDKIFIWGNKFTKKMILEKIAIKKEQIYHVEDGFIRSVSLGSDLTRPYSLVVDNKGLYIDPSEESELENILQNYEFDENLLERAKKAKENIIKHKFSKYNNLSHTQIKPKNDPAQKVILIPAQVEDDASMILGGMGFSTLDLIKEVRLNNPKAYIIFKPHPDVLSGNRIGLKDEKIILKYCDEVIKNTSIDSALNLCDEVHTITSTTGFEALLRNKKVFTYGLPFYAGWGLSKDRLICQRRTRKLSLDELIAGTLLLYPRYIDVKTKNLCEFEVCFDTMLNLQKDYFSKRHIRFMIDTKTFALRKIRRMFEFGVKNLKK